MAAVAVREHRRTSLEGRNESRESATSAAPAAASPLLSEINFPSDGSLEGGRPSFSSPGRYHDGSAFAPDKPMTGDSREDEDEGEAQEEEEEEDNDRRDQDLLFEHRMLRRRLVDETAAAKEAKDKVYFLMMRLKGKDEQISSLKESLRQKSKTISERSGEIADVVAEKEALAKKSQSLEARAMQLEYENYKLTQQLANKAAATHEESEAVHVKGVEKAKMLLAHQLFKQQSDKFVEQLRKRQVEDTGRLRRRIELLEGCCMEYEDEFNTTTLQALMRTLHQGKTQFEKDSRVSMARDLKFGEKVVFKAPDDEHVAALLSRSDYSALFRQCKDDLGDCARQLKELSDRSLQTLWQLFNEKSSRLSGGRHPSNKPFRQIFEEFYKTIDQTLIRSKQLVADFARRSNAFAKALVQKEKEVVEQIRLTRFSTCDVQCSVDIRPPTPSEVYELRHEVKMYERRLQVLNQEAAEKEHTLELRASKAENNLDGLQKHILHAHKALYTALHLVFKHRYRWTARMPDPLRVLKLPEGGAKGSKALEVSYNRKLCELLQTDQKYMETFGNYMMSDEFGANMVTATHGERRRRASEGGLSGQSLPQPPEGDADLRQRRSGRRVSVEDPADPHAAPKGGRRTSIAPDAGFTQPIGHVKRRDSRPQSLTHQQQQRLSISHFHVDLDAFSNEDPATSHHTLKKDSFRVLFSNNNNSTVHHSRGHSIS